MISMQFLHCKPLNIPVDWSFCNIVFGNLQTNDDSHDCQTGNGHKNTFPAPRPAPNHRKPAQIWTYLKCVAMLTTYALRDVLIMRDFSAR